MFTATTAKLRLTPTRLPLASYQYRQMGIFDYFRSKKPEEEVKPVEEESKEEM